MTVSVAVDWSRNGGFTDALDDVSARVRPLTGVVQASYGRDEGTALKPMSAGAGALVLANLDGALSPRNSTSPLAGKLKPARPVQIQRTVAGTTYTLFVGHTDDTPINPDLDSQTVSLTLVDSLQDFRGVPISTALYSGIRTGAAIGKVLDAVGWKGGRDLDLGGSVLPWWWEDGTDAAQALQNLLAAEGPPSLLTIGSSGEVVFRDRHHRLVRTASTTSQGTWRATPGPEPVMGRPFRYNEAWGNVVNYASLAVPVRRQGTQAVVWSSQDVIDLSTGQTVRIKATSSDPFTAAVAPVMGTDITVSAGSATVIASIDRTSGGSVTISLIAPGPARILGLQLRANPVTVSRTETVELSDSSSISDYGVRAHPDVPFASVNDVKAIVAGTLAMRAQPLPVVTVTFQVGGSTLQQMQRAAAVLARDLSDRVTIVEPGTYLNADFFIENIGHELTGDEDHRVTVILEAAPTQVANVFILGSATRGILGTNRLGKQGLDDPATVFILGSSSNGVLGTNLLGH